MVMSSKEIGKMVGADVDKALANIGSTRPDMKDAGAELKSAVAPKKAPSFGEAFRAARTAGDKTFTWGGKSYTTKMAGEGAQKPAPKAAAPTASPTNTRAQMELRRTAARSQAAIRDKRAENQADFRKRMQAKRSGESTYAKGGKIDGCAIRGKTRAPLKKGK